MPLFKIDVYVNDHFATTKHVEAQDEEEAEALVRDVVEIVLYAEEIE